MKRSPMKQSRRKSPTKAEREHMGRVKQMRCICCEINGERGLASAYPEGCDAHHTLSGGRRVGHMATLGICPWHHRGVKPYDMSDKYATELFGPSLAHGSKPFHAIYGTDAELFERQSRMLEHII